jgi:hypothetical protein
MEKKIYYLLMTAGSFAMTIMLGICVVWILAIAGCSNNPLLMKALPDKEVDLTTPPTITGEEYFTPTEGIVCCVPDEDFPSSCGGWKICEFNSKGDLI